MKKIKSVVIVGGGSSGWMSAAYLSKVLFDLDITLVESKHTPKIGVGEATTPILTRFMQRLGFRNWESWLPYCDGSLKTGILFENWFQVGDRYWHPFETLDYFDDRHHMGHCWLQFSRAGRAGFGNKDSFYRSFFVSTIPNCEQNQPPVLDLFAYHLNADLFGEFLQKSATRVRHVQDDVVDIRLNESGLIEEVITAEHGALKADFFIDCTGFRRKLIRTVDERQPYESYSSSLFCDRAVVLRFPYRSEESRSEEMHPYVKASAQSSGWIWTIPLYGRISSGYVYSSHFLSENEAEEDLRNYWGRERTREAVPLKVKFESGKLQNLWVKNCVAIGLAGSFVEPLESTGLAITQVGLELLASILDARCYDDFMVQRYNMHLQKFCDDIRQFIIAHYCFTDREDTPFWRHVKHDTQIPEDLAARLEIFQQHLPSMSTKGVEEWWFFRDISWFSVLLGMNFPFKTPVVEDYLLEKANVLLAQKSRKIETVTKKNKTHFEYLQDTVYRPLSDFRRSLSRTTLKNPLPSVL